MRECCGHQYVCVYRGVLRIPVCLCLWRRDGGNGVGTSMFVSMVEGWGSAVGTSMFVSMGECYKYHHVCACEGGLWECGVCQHECLWRRHGGNISDIGIFGETAVIIG